MNNDLEVAHSWVVLRQPFLVELEFRNEYSEKNLSGQRKEQRQTQTTFGVDGRIWTWATLVEGKRSHLCFTLAT